MNWVIKFIKRRKKSYRESYSGTKPTKGTGNTNYIAKSRTNPRFPALNVLLMVSNMITIRSLIQHAEQVNKDCLVEEVHKMNRTLHACVCLRRGIRTKRKERSCQYLS